MTTNRERQKRKRDSRIFHTILLIFIVFAILAVVAVGLRWMTGSGRNDNPASIAGTELSQPMDDSSSESTENSQPSSDNTQSESTAADTQEAADTTQLSAESTPAAVTTATDGLFAQMAGTWTLDGQVTNAQLEESGKEYHSLQEMFGTGSGYGGEVTIQPDGAITYYIGIGNGGPGQGEIIGDEISVVITPYESHSDEEEIRTFHLETVEEKQYLVMDFSGEKLYWSRKTAE